MISVWIFFAAILVIKIAAKKIHTEIKDYELLVPKQFVFVVDVQVVGGIAFFGEDSILITKLFAYLFTFRKPFQGLIE